MISNFCPHKIRVERLATADDGRGGQTKTYTIVYDGFGCIQPASAGVILLYLKDTIEVTHAIYVPKIIEAKANDLVTYKGRTFRICGVRNMMEMDICTILDAKEGSN